MNDSGQHNTWASGTILTGLDPELTATIPNAREEIAQRIHTLNNDLARYAREYDEADNAAANLRRKCIETGELKEGYLKLLEASDG